ncbi:glycosyltransferase family 4 protein [Saccharothrix violaceirubra]
MRVVTGFPYYPAWRLPAEYRWLRHGLARRTREHGVDVTRLWHHVPRRPTAIGRFVHEASFAAHALVRLLCTRPRPDVVVGVSPSLLSSAAARCYADRVGVPLAVVVQDLCGRGTRAAGFERSLLARAAGVSVAHDSVRSYLEHAYRLDPVRLTVIRDWAHGASCRPDVDRHEARRALGWPVDGFVALHAGNMGVRQDLVNVVEAARIAGIRREPVHFVLMGDGAARPEVVARARGLPRVSVVAPVAGDLLPTALGAADVLIVNERPGPPGIRLPRKLTAYFRAGRPVVAAAHRDSTTATEVTAARAGCVVEPGDAVALLNTVLDLARDRAYAESLAAAGLDHARRTLDRDRALDAYEDWLCGVAR